MPLYPSTKTSPAFTGDPTAPTATVGDSDTSVATTAFVAAAATAAAATRAAIAGDLGGTAASPTVIATHLASALPLAQGGTAATSAADARTSLGLGSAATMTPAEIAADSALTATYAQLSAARMAPGLRWAFGGDSNTNGTGVSNFIYSYSAQACQTVGGMIARADSVEAGTAGWRSDELLGSLAAQIATYAPDAWSILIGTNDASQGVTVDTYIGYLKQIISTIKASGKPLVLCTVPPRAAAAAASIHNLIRSYNVWIRLFAPSYGCEIADAYTALVDNTTGALTAAYDSGDGVHVNDAGHQAVMIEVAKAMKRAVDRATPYGLVTSISAGAGALIADPLNARATVLTGWFEAVGGTGTAPSYAFVADTSGVLPAGRWAEMDFTGTSGGVRRLQSPSISSGFAVGDVLLVCGHVQVEDVSGTWKTDVVGVTNNTHVKVNLWNQAGAVIGTDAFANTCGLVNASGFYDIGPIAHPVTVPAGTTSINYDFQVKVGTGKHIKARLGCAQVINLTTLGLTTLVSAGPSMINA